MRAAVVDRPATRRPGTSSAQGRSSTGGPRLLLAPVIDPPGRVPEAASELLGRPMMRSVLSPATGPAWPLAGPARASTPAEHPDPTRLCGSIVLAAVEALNGARPLAQLARWVSPQVLEALSAAAAAPTPVRKHATVRPPHVYRVSPTVVEASVVVHDGERVRAAALRLEIHRGHWRATALQIG